MSVSFECYSQDDFTAHLTNPRRWLPASPRRGLAMTPPGRPLGLGGGRGGAWRARARRKHKEADADAGTDHDGEEKIMAEVVRARRHALLRGRSDLRARLEVNRDHVRVGSGSHV